MSHPAAPFADEAEGEGRQVFENAFLPQEKAFHKASRVHGGERLLIAENLGLPPEEILDLSASINPLGPPKGVLAAIESALHDIDRYPEQEPRGLIRSIADRFRITEKNILVGNGSVELIYLLSTALAPTSVMILAPDFCEYELAFRGSGVAIDVFDLNRSDGFSLDFANERLLEAELLILSNPNNPTGRLFEPESLRRLAERRSKLGRFTVIDEAFMDFASKGSLMKEAEMSPGLVVLRSLTKFYALAGLRLGFAVASDAIMGRLRARHWPWSVNTLAAAAGEAALADLDYEAETLRQIARLRSDLMAALESFERLKPYPSVANYILIELQEGLDSAELTESLARQGVLVRDCSSFLGLGNRFIRVAVRSDDENGRLIGTLSAYFSCVGVS